MPKKKKTNIDLDVSDEKPKTPPTEFYHLVILDKSGSMSSVKDVTREGVNTNIKGMKKDAQENPEQHHYFSLVTFSYPEKIEYVRWMVPHGETMELANEDYIPDGGTALLDAIGLSINRLRKEIQPKLDDGSAVALVTIMTDGEENSSKEYNHAGVEALTKELQELKDTPWTITYIGSAPSARATAASMGISNANFAAYTPDQVGTQAVFDKLSYARSSYTKGIKGSSLKACANFFDDEQDWTPPNPAQQSSSTANQSTVDNSVQTAPLPNSPPSKSKGKKK